MPPSVPAPQLPDLENRRRIGVLIHSEQAPRIFAKTLRELASSEWLRRLVDNYIAACSEALREEDNACRWESDNDEPIFFIASIRLGCARFRNVRIFSARSCGSLRNGSEVARPGTARFTGVKRPQATKRGGKIS